MDNYKVDKIPKNEINEWLLKKHYAHTIPCVSYQFGLFKDGAIVGVCCFGSPACPSNNSIGEFKQVELVRLVIEEGLKKNILSFFVSRSLKLLPTPLSIISYADSKMGHHGYIYQATNWLYTGMGEPVANYIDEDGNAIHKRTFCEFRKKYPELSPLEIAHKFNIEKAIGSSKYRYHQFVGDKRQRRIWLKLLKDKYNIIPYPKGENRRYEMPKSKTKTVDLLGF